MWQSRAGLVFVVCVSVFCGVGGPAWGQATWGNGPVPGSRQADRHNLFSSNSTDSSRDRSQDQFTRSQGPASSALSHPAPHPAGDSGGGVRVVHYHIGGYPFLYGFYTYYPYTLGIDSGSFGPYVAPPVVVSGDAQFGPQAVQRFMGVNPVPGPQAPPPFHPRRALDADAAPPAPRADARARLRSWHLIDQGDAEFGQRRFAQALSRYRDATAAARDLAEAQFRQGIALVAMARFADAAKAFRQGLQLDPDWVDSNFHLKQLYGESKVVKEGHLDTLRKAVATWPHDPDLLFVLGVCLYFDDQADAAAPLFRRAANVLGPLDADHLAGFLKRLPPTKKAADKNGEGKNAAGMNVPEKNAVENKPAPRIPPPPLPLEDKPADKRPLDKPAERPFDPFGVLDPRP